MPWAANNSDSECTTDIDLFPTSFPITPPAAEDSDSLPSYTAPSYQAARLYRNLILPRRIADENQPTGYRLANPGELLDDHGNVAELYDFFHTKSAALDEFGIGISLYFRTLKAFSLLFMICGLISLIAIYENKEHQISVSGDDISDPICFTYYNTNNVSNYNDVRPSYRTPYDANGTRYLVQTLVNLKGSVYGAEAEDLRLLRQGLSDLILTCLLAVLALGAKKVVNDTVKRIDQAQQTTSDYSVVIQNPPEDITDPKIYHDFFSQFGEVVLVTVAKDNGKLLRTVAARKVTLNSLNGLAQSEGRETRLPSILRRFIDLLRSSKLLHDQESLKTRLSSLDEDIRRLSKLDYKPWKVFVTFNSEASMVTCINRMAVGKRDVWLNKKSDLRSLSFHNTVLHVRKAPEPSDIIYENSDMGICIRLMFLGLSNILCGAVMYAAFYIVSFAYFNYEGVASAVVITGINSSLPVIIKNITVRLEKHSSETRLQQSILVKLVIARCINSAFFVYWVTPDEDIFALETLQSIQNILIADALATPLFRLCNFFDTFQRYAVAPLYGTQAEFNAKWQGAEWTLAERYTDCLKTVFTGLFYAVPLPSGLFIISFTMISTYLVDKYSLFKLWRRKPTINESLGVVARYFFIFSVFWHMGISIFFFANWPFKEVCALTSPKIQYFSFDYSYLSTEDDERYDIVRIYVYAFYLSFFGLLCWAMYKLVKHIVEVFTARSETSRDTTNISFREIDGAAYVPYVHRKQLLTHLICCDLSHIPVGYCPIKTNSFDEIEVDPQDFSVYDVNYFDYLNESDMTRIFSNIMFFADPNFVRHISTEENNLSAEDYASSTLMRCRDLPTGWEARQCLDGRVFYVDHNNEEVTWIKPQNRNVAYDPVSTKKSNSKKKLRSQRIYRGSSRFLEVLPHKWEKAYTEDGRPYYIDHNTKRTHWKLPSREYDEEVGTADMMTQEHNDEAKDVLETALLINDSDRSPQCNGENMAESKTTELITFGSEAGQQERTLGDSVGQIAIKSEGRNPQMANPKLLPFKTSDHPLAIAYSEMSLPETNNFYVDLDGRRHRLPPGWTWRVSGKGNIYYVDYIGKKTSWVLPPSDSGSDTSRHSESVNYDVDSHRNKRASFEYDMNTSPSQRLSTPRRN